MDKILVILGPTAVGKSSFGLKCAGFFNGEIISGDSIQVYRGLDIGSAKATKEERQLIRHHLIDIKDPKDNYSVKEFQELGREKIEEIIKRGKLPIIVGGTGLYIRALIYDYQFFEENEEDDPFEELSNEEIYKILEERDPESLKKIHINNRKRLVRALNILNKHHKSITEIKNSQEHKLLYDAKIIALDKDRDELYRDIDERVDEMVKEGLEEEVRLLLAHGVSFDDQCMQAIGYKEFRGYFEGNRDLEEVVKDIKKDTRHFAKRQYTFFKNQFELSWHKDKDEALKEIETWLKI